MYNESRYLEGKTKEQLRLEYNVIHTLLEIDNITESVFIDFVNEIEQALMEECTKRFLLEENCGIYDFNRLLAVRS